MQNNAQNDASALVAEAMQNARSSGTTSQTAEDAIQEMDNQMNALATPVAQSLTEEAQNVLLVSQAGQAGQVNIPAAFLANQRTQLAMMNTSILMAEETQALMAAAAQALMAEEAQTPEAEEAQTPETDGEMKQLMQQWSQEQANKNSPFLAPNQEGQNILYLT